MTRWWEWLLLIGAPLAAWLGAFQAAWHGDDAKKHADRAEVAARDTDKAAEKIKAVLIGDDDDTAELAARKGGGE